MQERQRKLGVVGEQMREDQGGELAGEASQSGRKGGRVSKVGEG